MESRERSHEPRGMRVEGTGGPRGRGGPRGHGYQSIQRITAQSAGLWQPGHGSVYPALQPLEDEGLLRAEPDAGRGVFHLTATRAAVTAAIGVAPRQVGRPGPPGQCPAARHPLDVTRRELDRPLADDADVAAGAPPAAGE